jgi:hypothetical protein
MCISPHQQRQIDTVIFKDPVPFHELVCLIFFLNLLLRKSRSFQPGCILNIAVQTSLCVTPQSFGYFLRTNYLYKLKLLCSAFALSLRVLIQKKKRKKERNPAKAGRIWLFPAMWKSTHSPTPLATLGIVDHHRHIFNKAQGCSASSSPPRAWTTRQSQIWIQGAPFPGLSHPRWKMQRP